MLKDRSFIFGIGYFFFPLVLDATMPPPYYSMMTPGLSPCLFEQQTYIDQREGPRETLRGGWMTCRIPNTMGQVTVQEIMSDSIIPRSSPLIQCILICNMLINIHIRTNEILIGRGIFFKTRKGKSVATKYSSIGTIWIGIFQI